jgi:hypothetical protein
LSFKKFAPIALLFGLGPLTAMTGAAGADVTVAAPAALTAQAPDSISVLTYNIKGLPWPLAGNRESAFVAIEQRLADLRANAAQPHIIVLQEAFTDRAMNFWKTVRL